MDRRALVTKPIPTQQELKSRLLYTPKTGVLTWLPIPNPACKKQKIFNSSWAGKPAGCVRLDGRIVVRMDREIYWAHRLIWKMQTGLDPIEIDHINGDQSDNRWANLREATRTENIWNRSLNKNNSCGFKGVYQSSSGGWRATIERHGVRYRLGIFASPEQAHAAYMRAANHMHGRFAREITIRRADVTGAIITVESVS